mmetsp:Transcript_44584/g.110523  ORF Transcript_44584/g.110523 Transcript_44584/m.110523 type:complete len:207 (-) Transcript_44584:158-778(-)
MLQHDDGSRHLERALGARSAPGADHHFLHVLQSGRLPQPDRASVPAREPLCQGRPTHPCQPAARHEARERLHGRRTAHGDPRVHRGQSRRRAIHARRGGARSDLGDGAVRVGGPLDPLANDVLRGRVAFEPRPQVPVQWLRGQHLRLRLRAALRQTARAGAAGGLDRAGFVPARPLPPVHSARHCDRRRPHTVAAPGPGRGPGTAW